MTSTYFTQQPIQSAWKKADLLSNENFIYYLTALNKKEIEATLKKCIHIPAINISKANFQIPYFFEQIKQKFLPQIYEGIGVLVLKGLNTIDYTVDELSKIHWGLGLYFGKAQLQYGERLLKIEDQGYQLNEPGGRNSNTAGKLWFHNDSCDMTALMCIREAKAGGETRIVSSIAIHNKILKSYPDLLNILYQPFYRTYRHITGLSHRKNVHLYPVFNRIGNQFSCDLSRPVIENAQKINGVPKLTTHQIKALDTLERFAEDPELCHSFLLEPGDMIYMNNHILLHARNEFMDYPEPEKKRLLLRLHLQSSSIKRGTHHAL